MMETKDTSQKKNEIFISYNVEKDKILAKTVKDKLTILGKNRININFCEIIPGGKDWREWIWENIHKSSIFIFLYTRQESDWNWCIHEAGIFRGAKEKSGGHLICIKNSKITKYLAPINDLEAYNSDEESIKKFLIDLFHDGKFTNRESLNKDLFTDYADAFKSAYKDIAEQFALTPIRIDYLPKRLAIGPMIKSEDGTSQIESTPITANEETMSLFGLDESEHVWGDVYSIYHNENKVSWVDDILLSIRMINKKHKPRRLLHSFRSRENIRYYPVLSRIDRIENYPVYLYVIFIGERDVEEQQGVSSRIYREPEQHRFLFDLIRMARSFRWDILEWSFSEIEKFNEDQEKIVSFFDRLKDLLSNIEEMGEEEGMRLAEVVKCYFPCENHKLIENGYSSYWSNKKNLLAAIDERNIKLIIELLENWRLINKEFLLMAVNRYLEMIKLMKPLDI